ncbi:MAG: alpha/beta hydrolase family protein [Thermoanaerobaculia bacterium]
MSTAAAQEVREELPVATWSRPSHLAVRLSLPAARPAAPFCILYLHGFASGQSGEKAAFFRSRALAANLPFCSFDFQGHGESGGELRDLTFSRNLDDVARVHDYLIARNLGNVVLLGSSMGGATALWHAARRPERVLAGMHIAPAIGMGRALERWAGPARLESWQKEGTILYEEGNVRTLLDWDLVEDLRRFDVEVLASGCRTPTLLLQGKQDGSVDYRDVVRFVARAPGGYFRLQLFEDGDHRLVDRKPELWAEMLAFLGERRLL